MGDAGSDPPPNGESWSEGCIKLDLVRVEGLFCPLGRLDCEVSHLYVEECVVIVDSREM